jgi:hypothetical protein
MADDSSDGSKKDRNAPTVREIRPAGSPGDTMPDITGEYVPPRPLPEASEHRTLDLRSVRLSDQADPRRALTELRLASPAQVQSSSAKWWIVGGVALLFGVLVWVFFGDEPSPKAPEPALAPPVKTMAPVQAAPTPAAAPAEHAPAAPLPAPSSATEPAPQPKATRVEAPAASVAPRAPASREPEKKRRDPWLE